MDVDEERTLGRRPRGRPRGTGLDDAAELAAVADKIVTLESGARQVSPTAAMKQCVKGIGASYLRRLQVKWKAQGERLLAEARERVQTRREASNRSARAEAASSGIGQASSFAAMLQVLGARHPALGAMGRFDPALMRTVCPGFLAEDAARIAAYVREAAGISGLADAAALSVGARATAIAFSPPLVSEYARLAGCLQAVATPLTVLQMTESPIGRWIREQQEAMDRVSHLIAAPPPIQGK